MKKFSRQIIALLAVAVSLLLLLLFVGRVHRPAQPTPPAPQPLLTKSVAAPSTRTPLISALQPPSASAIPTHSAAPPAQDPFSAFETWANTYLATSAAGARAALLSDGESLAKARQAEMLNLIKSDPKRALRMAVSRGMREQLPPTIQSLLEEQVSGRGDFMVISCSPLPGFEKELPPTTYRVEMNHKTYEAFIYGRRLQQASHDGLSLHGVAIDKYLALSTDPLRILEPQEIAQLSPPKQAAANASPCAVCGEKTAVGFQPVMAQFGKRMLAFCHPAHAALYNEQLSEAESKLPPKVGNISRQLKRDVALKVGVDPAVALTPSITTSASLGPYPVTNLPPAGLSRSQGEKRLLLMPVLFADDPTPPTSIDSIYALAENNNRYYFEGSYGTASFDTTVTPYVQLPEKKIFYTDFLGELLFDALVAAFEMGYDIFEYEFAYVLFDSIPGVKFGGRSDGLLVGGGGAISHELGHNFGLAHANFWDTLGNRPLPPQPNPPLPFDLDSLVGHDDINAPAKDPGAGKDPPDVEYGDIYDVMGSGGGHFSAVSKNALNWLPDQFTRVVTQNETNRVYAFDTPHITAGRLYALRINKDYQRVYWASYRQGITSNPWESGGIELTWGPWSGTGGSAQLLDTTPGTSPGRDDAAVVVGRTYADPQGPMYLTPVAKGVDSQNGEKWIDVVVQFGPFPTNLPPTLDPLTTSTLTIPTGGTVTFSANASDPNGDPLAYYWDFGDFTFGPNAASTQKTFFNDGQYVVRCEVSDMKGGVASSYVVVIVGNPTTFTMSGRVTDVFGNPVQGARVHNCGSIAPIVTVPEGTPPPPPPTNATYRYSFTDSQGYYTIGNIPPGIYTNRAFIYRYKTFPLYDNDPVVLTNGNADGLDHLATPLPLVSISVLSNAFEQGPKPGFFNVSRVGDTNYDLPVRVQLGGTALNGTDYVALVTITTNVVNMTNVVKTNPLSVVTIPAGKFSTAVPVTPIDDTKGTGPKTVLLTLLLQQNDIRITTLLTNIVTTNGMGTNAVTVTNTQFLYITNQVNIPGFEVLPTGAGDDPEWFQTYPTYVLGIAERAVTIFDNDPPDKPTVSVAFLDSDAIEAVNDSATVTFMRSGGSVESNLVVFYSLSGTASNGVDYQRLSGSITIPAGARSVNLPIVGLHDLFVEGNQTVDVTVLSNPSYTVGGASSTEVILVNDNLPLISIYTKDSTAVRNGSPGSVTIEREGDLSQDLLINYLLAGTGVNGLDYAPLSGSVDLPPGQITVSIPIVPLNSGRATPLTVQALLSASTTYNISSLNPQATVTIREPLPSVTVSNSGNATEGGNGSFTVSRSSTNGNLLVNLAVGGSAIEGADYSPLPRTITIADGAASTNIQVQVNNDRYNEFGSFNDGNTIVTVSGDDTVILVIEPGVDYVPGNPASSTMTIANDDDADLPAVGFLLSQSSGSEDSGTAVLAVRISANPKTNQDPAKVDFKVTAGSAIAGVNYQFPTPFIGTTGTLIFPHINHMADKFADMEDSVQLISFPLLDDNAVTGNRTFTVSLFTHVGYITNISTNMGVISTNLTPEPTNCYVGEYKSHTFTIIDVGTTVLDIQATTPFAYEQDNQPGVFTITRSGGSTAKPLTVRFLVGGTASSGSDYVPLGTSVTIPAGTNSVNLYVVPNDDPTEEIPETVDVTLLDGPGYALGEFQATVVIVDNDGTIQFSSTTYTVNEGDGTASLGVQRSGNTNLLVTVDYLITGGTASNGVDYIASNGTLTFAPGQLTQNIPIQIINDTLVEPTETVSLVLTNPTGGIPLGGQRSATLFILDDDYAFVFATNSFRVNENGTNALISINRLGQANASATLTFWTSDGTATNGLDYRGVTNTITFASGDTNKSVLVPIIDDALFESNETVLLYLTNAIAGSTNFGSNSAILTIVDDESALQFASATFSVEEYAGFAPVVVQRLGGTVNRVSVQYQTRDGTAISTGTTPDYVAQSGTLVFQGDHYSLATNGSGLLQFQPGDSNLTINIPIFDNTIGSGDKTFSVILSTPAGPIPPFALANSTVLGTPTNTVVTILDNDTPGNVDYEFNPGVGPNARVLALALQPPDLRIVFGGEFTTVNGISFNRIARLEPDGNLDGSFNPGTGINGPVTALAAQADHKVLVGGTFSSVDSTNRSNLARLNEDGNLDLSFSSSAAPNNTVRAIAIQADGRVLIGGDFTQVGGVGRSHLARLNANGSVDAGFAPSVDGSVYTLAVQPDGNILLGGAFTTVGAANRASIARVATNGVVDLSFDPGTGANGTVTSLAVQSDGKVVVGGRFTVFNRANLKYVTRLNPDGSFDPGFDAGTGPDAPLNSLGVDSTGKILLGGDFISVNGVSRNRFARLNRDGSLDTLFNTGKGANDSVRALAVQPDSAIVIGGDFTQLEGLPRNYIARIHGDEKSDLTTVSFSASAYSVSEGAGAATISVIRSGNTNRPFTVSFATTNGTATPLADYFPTNGVLSFTNGDVLKTFTVRIIDDTLIEDNETINLFLTNVIGNAFLGVNPTAVLTILDNEKSVRFSTTNYPVKEDVGNAAVTLLRLGPSAGPVSVTFSTSDGTAQNGLDYLGFTNVVTFADGQSTQVVLVPIIDDSVTESTETINLTLSNPVGDLQLGLANATISILDNEPGPGGVDPAFKPGSGANNFVRALALEPDGKILVGGGFTIFDNTNRNYITRINSDGSQDLTFDPGVGADALVASLSSLPDGRPVLGGSFTHVNGAAYNYVARLLTNGAPDPSFSPGAGFNAAVNAIGLTANSRMVVGGGFSLPAHSIIQLLPGGGIDFGFSPGIGLDGPVHCVLPQSDGQVLMGGAFNLVQGSPRSRLARLNPDGSLDPGFVPADITNGTVYCVAQQADGKVIIGGDFFTTGKTNRVGIARLNSDGSLDGGFDPGAGADAAVFAVAVQPSGKIVLGGSFTSINNTNRNRYARLRSDGALDLAFDPGSGANNTVYSIVLLEDSNLLIGGAFNVVNGEIRNGIARIKADEGDVKFLGIGFVQGNQAQITLSTQPGRIYVIDRSPDLINWSPFMTNTAAGTTLTVTDPNPAPRRFYRARQL